MIEDFTFPYEISSDSFLLKWNKASIVPADIIKNIKTTLEMSFKKMKSLEQVSRHLAETLEKNQGGGEWLCSVSPLDMDSGLAVRLHKSLGFTFNRGTLDY